MPRQKGHDQKAVQQLALEEAASFSLKIAKEEVELLELLARQLKRRYPSDIAENIEETSERIKELIETIELAQ